MLAVGDAQNGSGRPKSEIIRSQLNPDSPNAARASIPNNSTASQDMTSPAASDRRLSKFGKRPNGTQMTHKAYGLPYKEKEGQQSGGKYFGSSDHVCARKGVPCCGVST